MLKVAKFSNQNSFLEIPDKHPLPVNGLAIKRASGHSNLLPQDLLAVCRAELK
jgi:hypothetical protein